MHTKPQIVTNFPNQRLSARDLKWLPLPVALLLLALALGLAPARAAILPNAWQIADDSNASGMLYYTNTLTAAQKVAATNHGWRFSVVSRLLEGSPNSSPGQFMIYGTGQTRFIVGLDTNNLGQLTARFTLPGSATVFTNLTVAGAGSADYHRHELVYDPVTREATYLFDGGPIYTWPGVTDASFNGQALWGAAANTGRGTMSYHHVQFAINGLGAVSEYDAGLAGSPALAPSPTTQGWGLTWTVPASTLVTNFPVSPDAVALPDLKAWQITDHVTTANNSLSYTTNLAPSLVQAATNSGWRYSMTSRLVDDFGATVAMFMVFGDGTRRHGLGWDFNAARDTLMVNLLGGVTTNVVVTNAAEATAHHTHELIRTNGVVSYFFDGRFIAVSPGDTAAAQSNQVFWGSAAAGGQGQVDYHRAEFWVNGQGRVAAYNAGNELTSGLAPSPTTQGWTRNQSGTGVTEAPVGSAPCSPTVIVTSTNDSGPGSLRQALLDACEGGTITFAPALNGQTIGLTSGELLPDRDVTIAGPGANLLTISGNGSNRVFFVNSGVNVLLVGLTLTRGNGAGSAPSGYGGSLYNEGTLTVSNCTLTANSALDGGALKNVGGTAYLIGTTVSSNYASFGGGLYSFNGPLTVVNSTVSGNTAAFNGSGIYNQGPLTVRSSTLTGNRAGSTGVGALYASGTERLTNCIVAGNYVGSGTTSSDLGGGAVDSAACNLIGSTGLGATNGNLVLSNTLAITRILDTNLAFNGGPTRTHALLPGSPAVDAGTNGALAGLDYDQRGVGFPRMVGSRVDIGAHERQALDSPFAEVQLAGLPGVVSPAMAWGDYDSDGRLDLLLTGYSPSQTNQISQLWRNTGTGFTQVPIAGLPGVGGGAVAWGDYDNDGRLDFLLTGYGYSQLWRNTGSGFTQVPIPGLLGVVNSAVAWGDYDNDGRLDFLLTGGHGSTNLSQLWRNTGSGFAQVPIPGLPAVSYSSLAWGDYDNDGRLDFLITGGSGVPNICQLWRNTGSGFTQVPIPGLPGVVLGSAAWGDYDNDGRLDFMLTGSGISQLWRNTGSGFMQVTIPGLPGLSYSSVAWGDCDNDGRLDFTLMGNGTAQLWRNTGGGFSELPLPALAGFGIGRTATWADYDNDGRLDFLFAGETSSDGVASQLWRNYSSTSNTPPTAPTGLASFVRSTNSVTLSWNPASDAQTPAPGLTYNLVLGTSASAVDLASPHANVASGFRRVVRLGAVNAGAGGALAYTFTNLPFAPQYFWSVQALDTALAGGPFAPAHSFALCLTNLAVASAADGGPGSLRDALACIAPGGTITFAPALQGQTLVLTSGELVIDKDLTLIGPGANLLAISGNASSRVFRVNAGVNFFLAGLTVTNGRAIVGNFGGGGILNEYGILTVSNCTISGNVAFAGGGIYNYAWGNNATLTILNSTLSGNSSTSTGFGAGAIFNYAREGDTTVTVRNCTISGNTSGFGIGGIGNDAYWGTATLEVLNTTFSGNTGLGIYNNDLPLGVANLTLGHTLLAKGAGGINLFNNGSVTNLGFNFADDDSAGAFATQVPSLLLAPLADNGGPTRTHALLPGSPAIDAGAGNLPNAWQIADVTSALNSGGIAYHQTLTPVQRTAATNAGWHFTVVSRMVAGSGGAGPAHFMVYGNGVRRFAVAWDLNPSGQLTATMDPLTAPFTTNLTAAGAAATNYHRHELVYNPVTTQATYLFDGAPIRTWSGENLNAQNGVVWWGGVSSLGRGRMNYHRAKFAINGLGTVADYLAGFQGYPASGPNPTNQSWSAALPAPGVATNAPISPDVLPLDPGVSNVLALDFDQRGPGYPRRIGSAVDIGAFELQATSASLSLTGIARTPAGVLLQVLGSPHEMLSLEWNSQPGPGGWQPLASIATDALGLLDYTDTTAAGQPLRFYRAVRP
jgi:hypothetical protein